MANARHRINERLPVVSLRDAVDANCAARTKLRDKMQLLENTLDKFAAEKQLIALGINLVAPDVEISLRLLQDTDPVPT